MKCGIGAVVSERDVKGDDVGLKGFVEGDKARVVGLALEGGVVGQDSEAEGGGLFFDNRTDVAYADDTEGFVGEVDIVQLGDVADGGEDIFGDGVGVGADSGCEVDIVAAEAVEVNMVGADSGSADKANRGVVKQVGVDIGYGPNQKYISVLEMRASDGAARIGLDVTEGREYFFDIGDVFVGYNDHSMRFMFC